MYHSVDVFLLMIVLTIEKSLSFDSPMMATGTGYYQLRPYDPTRESDRSSLDEICANVYGGGDYLPAMAASYAADPACSFLTLTKNKNSSSSASIEEDETLLAVANYKRLHAQNVGWIEAVRTHPRRRNQGLATALLRSVVHLSKEENDQRLHNGAQPTKIFTCTIQSNKGMIRALEKVGFVQCNTIPTLQLKVLKELPGWTPDCDKSPQPLLDALDLNHLVSPIARTIPSSSWCTISTEKQLLEWLERCKKEGGCSGYLPGLYEYIVPGPNRVDLKQSMEHGLVVAIDFRTQTDVSCWDGAGLAILAFTQDERISSLKSKWVCSIVAHSQLAFEVALWHAHSSGIARQMQSFQCVEANIDPLNTVDELVAALPFCLVFDDAVPLTVGTLSHALPRVTDECVVFSYQHDRSKES
jgi:GNAT superfamily N-acetyltransferase